MKVKYNVNEDSKMTPKDRSDILKSFIPACRSAGKRPLRATSGLSPKQKELYALFEQHITYCKDIGLCNADNLKSYPQHYGDRSVLNPSIDKWLVSGFLRVHQVYTNTEKDTTMLCYLLKFVHDLQIEHIFPKTPRREWEKLTLDGTDVDSRWDEEVMTPALGNLVLLEAKINAAASNLPWNVPDADGEAPSAKRRMMHNSKRQVYLAMSPKLKAADGGQASGHHAQRESSSCKSIHELLQLAHNEWDGQIFRQRHNRMVEAIRNFLNEVKFSTSL